MTLEEKIDLLIREVSMVRVDIAALSKPAATKSRQAFPLYRPDGSRRNQRRPAWWENEALRAWS